MFLGGTIVVRKVKIHPEILWRVDGKRRKLKYRGLYSSCSVSKPLTGNSPIEVIKKYPEEQLEG